MSQPAPSLHEIAAMPFPRSMETMRKYYNKDWHKPEPDGETLISYDVVMSFVVREERIYRVEAYDEKHAESLADDLLEADRTIPADADDYELVEIKVIA
ncbi:MAG TPA: hypothetical protein VF637_13425 [Sphingomicrobium sp.]|jgi:hypothetical protein